MARAFSTIHIPAFLPIFRFLKKKTKGYPYNQGYQTKPVHQIKLPNSQTLKVSKSQFTIHKVSKSQIHNSQFTTHKSQFTIHNSQLTIQNSQFTIHNSQLLKIIIKPRINTYMFLNPNTIHLPTYIINKIVKMVLL